MYQIKRNSLNRSYDATNDSKTLNKNHRFKLNNSNISEIKLLKIKSRKLPNDFWGQSLKKQSKVEKSFQAERINIHQTKHELHNFLHEQIIPEAQMTSFFKQFKDQSSTNPASPLRSPTFSKKKMMKEECEKKEGGEQNYVSEFTNSINNNQQPSSQEFGITFSNLKFEKKDDEQLLYEKVKSLEVRNLRKRIPAVTLASGRKSSFQRERLRPEGIRSVASHSSNNRATRYIEEINLPKIKKAH